MMSKLVLAVFAIVATLSQAFVPASNSWTGRVSNARIARAAPLQMSAEVEGKLKEIVAEQLGVEESSITSEANFAADLGADSLDVVRCAPVRESWNCNSALRLVHLVGLGILFKSSPMPPPWRGIVRITAREWGALSTGGSAPFPNEREVTGRPIRPHQLTCHTFSL